MITKNTYELKQQITDDIANDRLCNMSFWEGGGSILGLLYQGNVRTGRASDKFGLTPQVVGIAEGVLMSSIVKRFAGVKENMCNFYKNFGDAIDRDGKDLSRVHWFFMRDVLREMTDIPRQSRQYFSEVVAGMDSIAHGRNWEPLHSGLSSHEAIKAARTCESVAETSQFQDELSELSTDSLYADGCQFFVSHARDAGVNTYTQAKIFLHHLRNAPLTGDPK